MTREDTKAVRYIHELDEARCNGNWDLIPELLRKLKKHAPERACLALTAEVDHAINRASQARPGTTRPDTARSATAAAPNNDIQNYVPLLKESIAKAESYEEDAFQARVCLGWLYWHVGNAEAAISTLPSNIEQEFARLDGSNRGSSKWTRVCALKAVYIQGTEQTRAGSSSAALDTFESALPILPLQSAIQSGKEFRTWTELYLTGFCSVASKATKDNDSDLLETEALSAFRAWGKLWNGPGVSSTGGRATQADVPRRIVWKEYYSLLSAILQQDLPFPTTSLTTTYTEISTRLQQRAELKKVENRYESLLLSEIQFPKAEKSNTEVEEFVDLVIQNWKILCGSGWQDHELGEGGAEGISRGVLDILYRAATKTFHSTALLRHLFTVHLAVAEFDLAFKAFDTYMEIVKKGKARIEKTGIPETGLDSDDNVLRTASDYIKALCRYGGEAEAKQAKSIAEFFEEWLEKHNPNPAAQTNGNGNANNHNQEVRSTTVKPKTFAVAWRSIGIAYAQWGRLTFDGSARSDIQVKAIKCLRKALSDEFESTTDVETLFALGVILAERRELGPAIDVVKTGLLPTSASDDTSNIGPYSGQFARERALIPLWHLLALLLSARQEFVTAARSCEGAFEQFQDPKNLFGNEDLDGTFRSEHLNEKATARNHGIVDDMDDFEKENILEVKITQLNLVEVLEGPEFAVNASDELLSLYARLFGEPQKELTTRLTPSTGTTLGPPKSSAGTIRSLKGSIFGRTNKSGRKPQMGALVEERPVTAARPQTAQTTATAAPTIQVTNENGNTSKHHKHSKEHHHHRHEKLHKQESVRKKKSGGNLPKHDASINREPSPSRSATIVDGEKFFTPAFELPEPWSMNEEVRASQVGLAVSGDNESFMNNSKVNEISEKARLPQPKQMHQSEHGLQHHGKQDRGSPVSSTASSAIPVTRFSKEQQMRRRTTMLVKVWLLISGFYRRASLLEDARGAIDEAFKLVQGLEADVFRESTSGISIENSGMGGGKSVSELWGDVYSERGYLAVANVTPFEALAHFESALTNDADHPSATVGLSNILLDIFSENLLPPPSIPRLVLPGTLTTPSASTLNTGATTPVSTFASTTAPKRKGPISRGPLGLSFPPSHISSTALEHQEVPPEPSHQLPDPLHAETNATLSKKTQLLDRLAARDRAYGLLSNLTKLGGGWNYSEAWFALARAYELGAQDNKAREVLWWCVELEEARSVRGLVEAFGGGQGGGYVL